ncbi:uncharacterized protein LOC117111532 [Anneissia japonica]|uniref:uncharacterized protein LOC117111532 n=1 Tax=Anneissia japonica TaxID=1529436 RepID=UPI001425B455|nr:uncharacterized protein LOC117111532 [Anneissia japonica]
MSGQDREADKITGYLLRNSGTSKKKNKTNKQQESELTKPDPPAKPSSTSEAVVSGETCPASETRATEGSNSPGPTDTGYETTDEVSNSDLKTIMLRLETNLNKRMDTMERKIANLGKLSLQNENKIKVLESAQDFQASIL